MYKPEYDNPAALGFWHQLSDNEKRCMFHLSQFSGVVNLHPKIFIDYISLLSTNGNEQNSLQSQFIELSHKLIKVGFGQQVSSKTNDYLLIIHPELNKLVRPIIDVEVKHNLELIFLDYYSLIGQQLNIVLNAPETKERYEDLKYTTLELPNLHRALVIGLRENPQYFVDVLFAITELCRLRDEPNRILVILTQLLKEVDRLYLDNSDADHQYLKLVIWSEEAKALDSVGRTDEASVLMEEIETIYAKGKLDSVLPYGNELILLNLGMIHYDREEYEQARVHFVEAAELWIDAGETGSTEFYAHIANLVLYIGWCFIYQSEFQSALDKAELANELNPLEESPFAGRVWRMRANAYKGLEQYDDASNCLLQAQHLFEETTQPLELNRVLMDQGRVFLLQRRFNRAKAKLNSALGYFIEQGKLSDQALCFSELGKLHLSMQLFSEAEGYFVQASTKYRLIDQTFKAQKADLECTVAVIGLKRYKEALKTLFQLQTTFTSANQAIWLSRTHENIGVAYFGLKEMESFINNWQEAVDICREHQLQKQYEHLQEIVAQAAKALNEPEFYHIIFD
jgi:tetratricopeptide (TPR) repeat protein